MEKRKVHGKEQRKVRRAVGPRVHRVGMVNKKCEHGRERSRCKDCGGSGICEHGRRRSQCKECGGSGICEHGRERYSCKDCGGSSMCEHGRRRRYCMDDLVVLGGKKLKKCGVVSHVSTSMEDLVGYSCVVCTERVCLCRPGVDPICCPP